MADSGYVYLVTHANSGANQGKTGSVVVAIHLPTKPHTFTPSAMAGFFADPLLSLNQLLFTHCKCLYTDHAMNSWQQVSSSVGSYFLLSATGDRYDFFTARTPLKRILAR